MELAELERGGSHWAEASGADERVSQPNVGAFRGGARGVPSIKGLAATRWHQSSFSFRCPSESKAATHADTLRQEVCACSQNRFCRRTRSAKPHDRDDPPARAPAANRAADRSLRR